MLTFVVKLLRRVILLLPFLALSFAGAWAAPAPIKVNPPSSTSRTAITSNESIPWSEICIRAGEKYSGEALSVTATETGARLRTDFQRLRGEVTEQGLMLESTVTGQSTGRFALRADSLGREKTNPVTFAHLGRVETLKGLARWVRPGVVEEYSVSVDGVRQDFVITEQPKGVGPLRLELTLSGGKAEAASYGADITLDDSGRKLAYNRIKAWDAAGHKLHASMAAVASNRLTVVVEDAGAVWPVRIDPTFSDANWVSMSTSGPVYALVWNNGNLYVGGSFTQAGSVPAKNIALWNGNTWSALGAGLNGKVEALVLISNNLYAGGTFASSGFWQWDGSSWYTPGGGVLGEIRAIATDGVNLYVGGVFTQAGSVPANNIAKWNGSAWSALGSGLVGNQGNTSVNALAFDSTTSNLYVGGVFYNAGGVPTDSIAACNVVNNTWSPLGSGISGVVLALATGYMSLYAGGNFNSAGGVLANNVAEWSVANSTWSPIGTGMNGMVTALVTWPNLYASGYFTTAGGVTVNHVAEWDGYSWSPLGSGLNYAVNALTTDMGGNLYVGGYFTTAGGNPANYLAKATFPVTYYNVTYKGNANTGGSVPVDPNLYPYGASVTVLGNTGSLVKTGYAFSGWNTQANGSGTNYGGGDKFVETSNVTLYAQWLDPVRIGGNYFPTLTDAYSAAQNGNTIQAMVFGFAENLNLNQNITVDLIGGYDKSFLSDSGDSILTGSLTISQGAVTIKNLVIQ